MAQEHETYKGKDIAAMTEDPSVDLTIDGQPVPVEIDGSSGRFATELLPYGDYATVMELARAVIDNVRGFMSA